MGKKRTKKPARKEVDLKDMQSDEDIDMHVVTDSEDEYTETEKKLLKKVRDKRTIENYDSENEIYGLHNSEDEEEEDDMKDSMDSDIEELQEDDDMPNDRAWGNQAKTFYSSDFKHKNYASASQTDMTNAKIEEEEARKLHVRLLEEFSDPNLDFDFKIVPTAKDSKNDQEDSEEEPVSKRDEMLFMALVNTFKECLKEVKILAPFLELVENGLCPDCSVVDFVKTKYHVILNYCINISFYLMIKAKPNNEAYVRNHPVLKRIAQYRQMLIQLESGQGKLLEQIVDILKAVKEGKPLYNISDGSEIKLKKRATRVSIKKPEEDEEYCEPLNKVESGEGSVLKQATNVAKIIKLGKSLYTASNGSEINDKEQLLSDSMDEASIDDDKDREEKYDGEPTEYEKDNVLDRNREARRPITYEMSKNRGLTPYRKKELRNPRVKHRNKYRKAKIRRKGAVREVRNELTRYGGERSGIKAGAKRGIKFKY